MGAKIDRATHILFGTTYAFLSIVNSFAYLIILLGGKICLIK
ncbi:MAG: hypothetical protein QXP60_07030 [Nitrososphaerota archaeon]